MKKQRNMWKLREWGIGVLVCLCLAACDKNSGGEDPDELPVRTMLVYLAVDNNFDDEAKEKITTLTKYWRSSFDGNLLIYSDAGNANLVRVYSDSTGKNRADTIRTYGDLNSADPEVFKQVLEEIKEKYPARSYGMLVLSHASGWLPRGTLIAPRSVINDKGREMEFRDFVSAISMKMDFMIFDACFMGEVEIAYELREKVKYLVASPAEVLSPGFVYSGMMAHLMKDEADVVAVAREFYEYYNAQNGFFRSATVSVVNTEALEELAVATREIWKRNAGKSLDVTTVQSFGYGTDLLFFDLGDYVHKLDETAYTAYKKTLEKCVIYSAHTPGYYSAGNGRYNAITAYSGLSVYIPQPEYPYLNTEYQKLKWPRFVMGE